MLNKISKQRSSNRKRKGKGVGSGLGKQLVEVIKAKNHDQVSLLEILKVGKCLFTEKHLSGALIQLKN